MLENEHNIGLFTQSRSVYLQTGTPGQASSCQLTALQLSVLYCIGDRSYAVVKARVK